MHALRRYLLQELDSRGWQPRDLVVRSGLSKQRVSQLLNDDREVMPQLPRTSTLGALAQAFNVPLTHITSVAIEALGVPGVLGPKVVHQVREADDETLLRELLRRAIDRDEEQPPAPVAINGRRDPEVLAAELDAAVKDLEEWVALDLGEPGEAKRAELQARVDALRAQLVSSRSATVSDRNVSGS
ncbi:MAG TPA: helix-turn-helix transcriptional regulator [Mycobacterium sp.]|jgi:transcriptional regulator with XRE-family HTH domain|uniref:helix-turn-helix domain-containing protein n=1 Tax=Mycobacterium sp. TaxID=1785 RepID=UPI002F41AD66